MKYEIRTYSEEYLQQQFEIGNSHLSTWPGTGQTTAENLKQYYSGDNFDPETKFYAFEKATGQMVGFQTATIKPRKEGETITRANIEFPLVNDGYEEVVDLMMQNSIEKLKEKGVSRIQSRASDQWGKTMEYMEKYGYTFKRTLNSNGTIHLENFQIGDSSNVREYNESTDLEAIRKMYLEEMKMPEKQLNAQLDYIKNNSEAIASWNVYLENGNVVGNSVVTYLGGDKSKGIMGNIFASEREGVNTQEVRKQVLMANVEVLKAKDVQELNIILFGNYLGKEQEYNSLGFQFNSPLNLYHKDI